MPRSRIPFLLGIGFTTIGLVIGCFAARVSTFTCIRNSKEPQELCRLEQSTLFLPWNKQIRSFQLDNIEKAESVEVGGDRYTVVLRSRNDAPDSSLYESEYFNNSQQLASQINSFLSDSEAEMLSVREGGGIQETIVLLSFCGLGLLLTLAGLKFRQHPTEK